MSLMKHTFIFRALYFNKLRASIRLVSTNPDITDLTLSILEYKNAKADPRHFSSRESQFLYYRIIS